MALSNDIRLYDDIRSHLDRALDSSAGIRINCQSRGMAINLRQRLYKLRALEKERSVEVYPPNDLRRATTPWDLLYMTVVDNALIITHRDPVTVEDL